MTQHVSPARPAAAASNQASHEIETVSDHDFAERVLASPVPVLVDFAAEWCSPCRVIEPIVEKIAQTFSGRARVFKVDADASPKIAAHYRVRSLPTVIAFAGGEEVRRHIGTTSMDVLAGLLPLPR